MLVRSGGPSEVGERELKSVGESPRLPSATIRVFISSFRLVAVNKLAKSQSSTVLYCTVLNCTVL